MPTMKLCKHCRYVKHDWLFGWAFATCHAPQVVKLGPVNGVPIAQYCSAQRKFRSINATPTCGPDAKFFEPKGALNAN